MLDLVIRNGKVVDGSGLPAFNADVGVKDGVIVKVGPIAEEAVETSDGRWYTPWTCYQILIRTSASGPAPQPTAPPSASPAAPAGTCCAWSSTGDACETCEDGFYEDDAWCASSQERCEARCSGFWRAAACPTPAPTVAACGPDDAAWCGSGADSSTGLGRGFDAA